MKREGEKNRDLEERIVWLEEELKQNSSQRDCAGKKSIIIPCVLAIVLVTLSFVLPKIILHSQLPQLILDSSIPTILIAILNAVTSSTETLTIVIYSCAIAIIATLLTAIFLRSR